MEFFNFLKKESTEFDRKLIAAGTLAGILNGALIFILSAAAARAGRGQNNLAELVLVAVCLGGYWFSKAYLLKHAARIIETIIHNTRIRLAEKVRGADLASLEAIGSAPFYSVVSTHALNISRATTSVVSGSSSLVLVICACLVIYLISPTAFLIFGVTLGLIILVFLADRGPLMEGMEAATRHENKVLAGYQDLLGGFKELKMNSAKNRNFFEDRLRELVKTACDIRIQTHFTLNKSVLLATSSLAILLTAVVFLLPTLAPGDVAKVPRIVTIIVFMFSPLGEVIGVYPYLTQAVDSIREIYRLEGLLNNVYASGKAEPIPLATQIVEVESIRCENLTFSYRGEKGEKMFSLAPVQFQISKGEMVFITGGNGSGKSTFLKVLAGLYVPAEGTIFLNGNAVGPDNRQSYRDHFSAIFPDFHLFDELYGIKAADPEKIRQLLEMTDLLEKTSIMDGKITQIHLSSGQKKRLALVVALLEDKQVLIFDEWAAEQDPPFRRKFYREILPELKRQGKTIIAITHDDDHYEVADRVLKMHYGQLLPLDAQV